MHQIYLLMPCYPLICQVGSPLDVILSTASILQTISSFAKNMNISLNTSLSSNNAQ